jgi:class 3 adenylate cyclase
MPQVADWLEKLGLGQYGQRFAENDISFSVLSDLTDQDLKEIGVSLGHRRQLLREIANLGKTAAAPSAPSPTAPPFATPTAKPPTEAAGERRHVTVMFCDLVDSTGIAAKLDAEEWRDLVGPYLDAASAAVIEMGGKVAKKLGDGLMALFGHPVAQENDAERAVRAALAIQRSLDELNRMNVGSGKPALAARVAIDSGPVVVDAVGEIFGDVPNVAARAQALAEPGAVIVTTRVQRQVAGLFVAARHRDRRHAGRHREPAPLAAPWQLGWLLHPVAQPRGNLGFLDEPLSVCRPGIARQEYRVAEAPHRSAGAHGRCSLDQLRCLIPGAWAEA